MRIMSADFDPLPSHFSEDLRCVITKMLALNPEDRPSVSELLEFPIIRQAREGLPSIGTRTSVDLTSRHVGDGTPMSHGGVSPTQPQECGSAAAVQGPSRRAEGLSIDASIPVHDNQGTHACLESVSPITPIGSEGVSSSLTSPQPPDSAMKPAQPVQPQNATDPLHAQQQQISENYADDFEPEPDDAWEAQLPRSRAASSEAEHIQEEEGALRTDSAALPDFIEDECSDGSYEDDFDVEQDVAIPAVKLNGSICAVPFFDAYDRKAQDFCGLSADPRSSSLDE
jgi:serine/threonine protein kinase